MSLVSPKTLDPALVGTRLRFGPAAVSLGRSLRRFSLGLPAVLAFALLWEVAPRAGWINSLFFPPLSRVLLALGEMMAVLMPITSNFILKRGTPELPLLMAASVWMKLS